MLRVLLVLVVCCWSAIAAAAFEVQDDLGRTIRLDQPAQRIVALAPHIVENLFAVGAGSQVVGAVDYADYPEAARSIPRVGAISSFSLEAIIALKPDLVVIWHGGGRGGLLRERLQALGLAVYASDPRQLEDVARSLRNYGILSGHADRGRERSQTYLARLEAMARSYRTRAEVSAMYQVWHQPIQTLNGEHIISDVIALCGGSNAFADAVPLAPKLSVEAVIAADPEVILSSGDGSDLDLWRAWPQLTAVRADNLYHIPADFLQRHTPRLLQGTELMCRHLDRARQKRAKAAARQ